MPSERIHVIITVIDCNSLIDCERHSLGTSMSPFRKSSGGCLNFVVSLLLSFSPIRSSFFIRLRVAYTFANLWRRARGGRNRASAGESAEVAEFCYYYPVNSAVKTQTLKGAARPPLAGATTGGRRTMTRGEEDLFAKLFN